MNIITGIASGFGRKRMMENEFKIKKINKKKNKRSNREFICIFYLI